MSNASTTLAALLVCVAATGLPAQAADSASAAKSTYAKDRADCNAGKTAEDRATCMKEAGAAQDERRRNRLDTNGSTSRNAVDRCNTLPAADKADCLARIGGAKAANTEVTTSGSVAGGGVMRETKTTSTTVTPAPAASATR